MPKGKDREFTVGDFWLAKKPGRDGPDGNWCRCWYDSDARQTRYHSLGTTDLQAAKNELTEWFLSQFRPSRAEPAEVLVEQILLHYFNDHASKLPSAVQARIACDHLSGFFEGDTLTQATRQRQRDYIEHRLDEGVRETTVERELSVFKAAVRRAYDEEQIDWLPALISYKAERVNIRGCFLSYEEMARAFDVMVADQETWLLVFAVVALNTLARPDANTDLTLFQCDFDQGLIQLNPPGRRQTKKRRPTVPMTATLRPYLAAVPGPHVVQYRGKPLDSVKSGIRRLRERAKLPKDFTAYSFRRSAIRHLRRMKVPKVDIQGMSGHSDLGVTDVYAPYEPDYLSEAKAAVEGLLEHLQALTKAPIVEPAPHLLRAACVPDQQREEKPKAAKSLRLLVGERGFEPPAPTSRTKRNRG